MIPTTPRLAPIEQDLWNDEQKELLGKQAVRGNVPNILKTLIHHEKLARRWLVFAAHILSKSSLTPRDREIAILRTGWLAGSRYEWGQHVLIGKETGLTAEEIDRIKAGPNARGWSEADKLLLQATDELRKDAFVSDSTWQGLTKHFDKKQLMDMGFAVGQYNLVSMALNTLGVQLDDGLEGF